MENYCGVFMILRKRANTLVELMVVLGIIAAIAAIAIPNFLKARALSNEATAQETLRAISTALENYQITNGTFPNDINALTIARPSYLTRDYFSATYAGYNFTVDALADYSYAISAAPDNPNANTRSFTITTGAILNES